MNFSELGLCSRIIRALDEKSYTEPSPIQQKAIPIIAAGSDLIACAQTGTGKTAAFALPLIERIVGKNEEWRQTSVLVLSPTRELASQIVENITHYTKYLPIRCAAIYGGVSKRQQIQALSKGVHIIVATPGRLLDHLGQGTIDLKHIETLVLDEADRMLDMGFIKDVYKIMRALPRGKRQTLLFSATFSNQIKDLSTKLLKTPVVIRINQENATADRIEQTILHVSNTRKPDLLSHLIQENNWKQVLVFTRTKRGANRLSEELNNAGYQSRPFHSNKSQEARQKTLESFKKQEVDILVATDIVSRGIDISDLPLVVNYDLPELPENYVHRIGRTGRAGRVGQAVSFVSPEQQKYLKLIETMLKKEIPEEPLPNFKLSRIKSLPKKKKKIKS
jgi:ATP-dependent RNA helicase RhlE